MAGKHICTRMCVSICLLQNVLRSAKYENEKEREMRKHCMKPLKNAGVKRRCRRGQLAAWKQTRAEKRKNVP